MSEPYDMNALMDFISNWRDANPEYEIEVALGHRGVEQLVSRENKDVVAIVLARPSTKLRSV